MVLLDNRIASRRSSYVAGVNTVLPDLLDPLNEKRKLLEAHGIMKSGDHRRCTKNQAPNGRTARLEKFYELMRKNGDGHIFLAWMRYFDRDCDGKLRFRDFCKGLSILGYTSDVLALWHDLVGEETKFLTIQNLDVQATEIIDYFRQWCFTSSGGPYEVFTTMVSNSLEMSTAVVSYHDFLIGLESLGFFHAPALPDQLATPDLVRANLLSLIDRNRDRRGVVAAKDMLFLENDESKKERLRREVSLVERFGREEVTKKMLPKNADRMLSVTQRWTSEEWRKHLKETTHRSSNEKRPTRPSSAPPGGRRPARVSFDIALRSRRPASAPSSRSSSMTPCRNSSLL